LKPLSNGCLGIIIKINLTTNYQLLLNFNKVHRADSPYARHISKAEKPRRKPSIVSRTLESRLLK
jgi:hypothetical protein